MNADGKRLALDVQLDFSEKDADGAEFLSPVSVRDSLVNIGGSIELEAEVSANVRYVCDRCCEKFDSTLTFRMKELLRKEETDSEAELNPDVIYFKGSFAELDEIVLENIFLNLPVKRVCKPDCRGLCPMCGRNLNRGECECDTRTADPRFDVLDKFFE